MRFLYLTKFNVESEGQKLFAYQPSIIPDVICMAKGLGGGFPIGAILVKDEAAAAFAAGRSRFYIWGNPLALQPHAWY